MHPKYSPNQLSVGSLDFKKLHFKGDFFLSFFLIVLKKILKNISLLDTWKFHVN